jgi:hypothetical protein
VALPLAFLSFDIKLDEGERARFIEESSACSEPFRIDAWSVEQRTPRSEWAKVIHGRMSSCDFMVVLISAGMDTKAVGEEIKEARRCNVPFFGVYVAGPTSKLPEGLPANRAISWDWERIATAVRQVGGEGKHHVFH